MIDSLCVLAGSKQQRLKVDNWPADQQLKGSFH